MRVAGSVLILAFACGAIALTNTASNTYYHMRGAARGASRPVPLLPDPKRIYVRPSIFKLDPNGTAVASLRVGVRRMQNIGSGDPTDPWGWNYQANAHDTSDAVTNAQEGQVWLQCQHGSFFFFSWHRMYLYYYERNLRYISGDPNLVIPYWNYTDDPAKPDPDRRQLPLVFRQQTDANGNPNPLFVSQRAPGMNDGTGYLFLGDVQYQTAFNDTNFDGIGSSFGGGAIPQPSHFDGAYGDLELTPHNAVHVDIGGWMGNPQTAARDPVFLLHHANIDRLWKRWLDKGGGRQDPSPPDPAAPEWLNQVFSFYDAQTGQVVSLTGSQVEDTAAQLNYCYDDDPVCGFLAAGSMAATRYDHEATLLGNGNVLITGGVTPSTKAELFNAATGVVSTTGAMAAPLRYEHTATLLSTGKALVAGGFSCFTPAGCPLATAELYDPTSGTFATTGAMTVNRGGHSATLLPSGKVLIAGGLGAAGYVASAEIYDPSAGTFTATGTMSAPRGRHTATLLPNGKVLIAGGVSNVGNYLAAAELYDPATGAFTVTGSMSNPRWEHTATLLQNGQVLVTGGVGSTGYLTSAEVYDPSAGQFAATNPMATARVWHTATLLPSGQVLILGGLNTPSSGTAVAFATAELYDPGTGSFVPEGWMTTARSQHTATLLLNGKILIVGGDVPTVGALSSAELF